MALFSASSAFSITLKEAFDEINSMPDLKGVENVRFTDILGGWIDCIPVDEARVTAKVHEVGSGQTVYYGSKVEEIRKRLPEDNLVCD